MIIQGIVEKQNDLWKNQLIFLQVFVVLRFFHYFDTVVYLTFFMVNMGLTTKLSTDKGICLHQIHNLVPELAVKPEAQKKAKKSLGENIKSKAKFFFDGWKLFVKQSVFIPGLVLAIMYINILGMSFPLQGIL